MNLNLPKRTQKPRENGLSMIIDAGLPLSYIKDTLEMSIDYIDYVKIGWGTALVTRNLKEKIALYKEYGLPISLGGTLFEIAYMNKQMNEFKDFLFQHNIEYVEISDGSIDLSLDTKIKLIHEFSKDFKVLSEVGSKDVAKVIPPKRWVKEIQESLNAGAWKVIAEGRESGTAGLYRGSSEVRTGLIEEILDDISINDLIFEAPQKSQQIWFINEFGAQVNLGNIAFNNIVSLETLRLGLRNDTIFLGDK